MMFQSNLKTANACIHYVQKFSGPDIVWCPGGDQIGEEWEEQFNLFPDFLNTSFDPRGAGKTISFKKPPWSINTYAHDLAELIKNVCNPPVIIIGLSMGALIVQEILLKFPELCRFGIAMGTSGKKSGFIHEWEEAEIKLRTSGLNLPSDFSLVHYALLMYPSEVLGDDKLWEKCKPIVSKAYSNRNSEMLSAQWQACLEYSAISQLPNCKRPIHVIAFDQDMQTPPAKCKLVSEAAAEGYFHLLKGLGHCSIFRHKPEVVSDKIREIISFHKE